LWCFFGRHINIYIYVYVYAYTYIYAILIPLLNNRLFSGMWHFFKFVFSRTKILSFNQTWRINGIFSGILGSYKSKMVVWASSSHFVWIVGWWITQYMIIDMVLFRFNGRKNISPSCTWKNHIPKSLRKRFHHRVFPVRCSSCKLTQVLCWWNVHFGWFVLDILVCLKIGVPDFDFVILIFPIEMTIWRYTTIFRQTQISYICGIYIYCK